MCNPCETMSHGTEFFEGLFIVQKVYFRWTGVSVLLMLITANRKGGYLRGLDSKVFGISSDNDLKLFSPAAKV